jgi:hypothetical protein
MEACPPKKIMSLTCFIRTGAVVSQQKMPARRVPCGENNGAGCEKDTSSGDAASQHGIRVCRQRWSWARKGCSCGTHGVRYHVLVALMLVLLSGRWGLHGDEDYYFGRSGCRGVFGHMPPRPAGQQVPSEDGQEGASTAISLVVSLLDVGIQSDGNASWPDQSYWLGAPRAGGWGAGEAEVQEFIRRLAAYPWHSVHGLSAEVVVVVRDGRPHVASTAHGKDWGW